MLINYAEKLRSTTAVDQKGKCCCSRCVTRACEGKPSWWKRNPCNGRECFILNILTDTNIFSDTLTCASQMMLVDFKNQTFYSKHMTKTHEWLVQVLVSLVTRWSLRACHACTIPECSLAETGHEYFTPKFIVCTCGLHDRITAIDVWKASCSPHWNNLVFILLVSCWPKK